MGRVRSLRDAGKNTRPRQMISSSAGARMLPAAVVPSSLGGAGESPARCLACSRSCWRVRVWSWLLELTGLGGRCGSLRAVVLDGNPVACVPPGECWVCPCAPLLESASTLESQHDQVIILSDGW
jgi:hypothetical protein